MLDHLGQDPAGRPSAREIELAEHPTATEWRDDQFPELRRQD
jgi:hypothetical protein